MIVLCFIRSIFFTEIYKSSIQVQDKCQNINESDDREYRKDDIEKSQEKNSEKRNLDQGYKNRETYVEENKPNQVLRLKDIINIPTDEGNIGKNDLTMNTYNNCEAIPARNTYLFQNNYENSAAYYNQQIYQSQKARSFNMYETSPNRFSHSTSTVYPWFTNYAPSQSSSDIKFGHFLVKKYLEIKILDYDSPLVSFFPGIIMLKDFIYKLLLEKVLQDRNIFNIFVGMKMIESLLFSSKEMIAGLSKENSLDIFSYGHSATNIIIAHKKIFFKILRQILCKNFNLSRNIFITLRITEIGCDYLNSIFFLDDMLMNTVSNIYEKRIIDVDLQTGFVAHTFFDFSILENFEMDPDLSLKFIKYYLILLQNEEFISSANINKIDFKNVIENLAIEVDKFEKELTNSCSSQPKEHINLLFKCLSIFNFIIKCGYNINIHNSLYLERISEISIL
ncbi:hypothetical protein CWI36_0160p0010 [Hamiltosporidium magnivora]|uniref:Uncharacterized protein n=2 Tax=Hamiltosporidium magnivora TaxID=148818 RepID=A0A4Q9LJA4_9MICR|nr:hypothetical protein CWI36_0160p0010 [Hamiltosporidium magnivora]